MRPHESVSSWRVCQPISKANATQSYESSVHVETNTDLETDTDLIA
jgi:hypothetical protein